MDTIKAKTIVSGYKSDGNWFGINYNMNIYKGCCHGCIYCDSRSECYHIDDFDTVKAKEDALTIIRNDLRRKVKSGVVATGAMSDPYNPFEKEMLLTRHALELINAYGFGAAIATKSSLIERDIDILNEIREHSPVIVKITVTASDDELSSKLEPNVSLSSERFDTIKKLSDNGIYTGVLMMPILPFIEDNEENIIGIIHKSYESGAKFIYPAFGVTLRQNQREYFYKKLDEKFSGLKSKYEKQFGNQYSCSSPKAKELYKLFSAECDRLGMLYKMPDIIFSYKMGYRSTQLSFIED